MRVIAKATPGHTRCPAYIRGKEGVIQLVYPIAYYPNFEHIRRREHSYAVEFAAAHVDGDPSQTVLVELIESYLEAAMSASHEALPAAATVIASPERRAVALRDALVDRGLVEAGEAEALAHRAPEVLSPANGARVVARTWVDPDFRKRLLAHATAAANELGIEGIEGHQMVAVENTTTTHNVIVCTQCSLVPRGRYWACHQIGTSHGHTARASRALLAELSLQSPAAQNIRGWDTSGETRYVVLPMRPQGTEHLTEEQLASLVTRDALIGVARIEDQATG